MKWFYDVKVSVKLMLSFGLIILLLVFVIFSALSSLNKIASISEENHKKHLSLIDRISEMSDSKNTIYSELLVFLIRNNKTDDLSLVKKMSELYENQEENKNAILEIVQQDPVFLNEFNDFLNLRNEEKKLRENQVITAITAGKNDEARMLLLTGYKDVIEKMSKIIDKMTNEAKIKANLSVEHARKEVVEAKRYFFGIGVLSIILSILLIIILNQLIAYPLNELSGIARQIAERNLILPNMLFLGRKDEVGVLGNSFKIMVENLRELTNEIVEAINHLSSSSNQIVTASNQLAASAAETATSINETTSTIEEVKQTSQVASKKAKSVSDATAKTEEMSNMGKKATAEMTEVIAKIHNQMILIAETMTRLSEQTQTVGTIISTVEDLSQQTNLLAVNASIEASKAGEQGKGFSVVAQEVKSLATQSKQATNQVRGILNDIQKATSAAVMASELGGKAVETGVMKTDEANEAILGLIKTVTDNAQSASQIAAVNHQQLVGMEQAKIAMDNIRQAGEQNLESAKLLKDSMVSMQGLGMKLKQMVDQFKLHKKDVIG